MSLRFVRICLILVFKIFVAILIFSKFSVIVGFDDSRTDSSLLVFFFKVTVGVLLSTA